MIGHHVTRWFGWDCHGLLIEFEIDKKLGIKTREQVIQMGIDNYNEECRSIVTRGFKVMPYSTGCKTSLSNFEANSNYKDIKSVLGLTREQLIRMTHVEEVIIPKVLGGGGKLSVLSDPTGRDIGISYELGQELGRGEFRITYLCTNKSTGDTFACKSISKKRLRTAMDIKDVRREVEIMKHLPPHPNIVRLNDTYEADVAVHLVMELCQGGELLDRIVARGIIRNSCHIHGVIHRVLKPENFLFANKKEATSLKAIDFGLPVFFKPETETGVAQAIIRSVIDFKRDPWPKVLIMRRPGEENA
ncbi:hypothetical protein GIB67_037268 [Kingdonia uniflora]|uniref:non-specific serine/threonine protein kinase n=1 Tax=Kingdonia uniflora TaxID=39325 RepID=A0A7J7MS12_9MAGN|nr:hypothetical protein GIB67_037268 [Kingdonia uniflora]